MDLLSEMFLAFIPDITKSIYRAIPNAINKYKMKKFFGPSVSGEGNFWLVVDPYYHPLPRTITTGNRYVKHFLGRRPDQPLIGEDRVLGSNILRLLGYLSGALAQFRDSSQPITFVSDEDVANRWDGSFVCFGSSDSNIKTLDIETLPQNGFYQFLTDQGTGWRYFKVAGRDFKISPNEDKAIILRVSNTRAEKKLVVHLCRFGRVGYFKLYKISIHTLEEITQTFQTEKLYYSAWSSARKR